MIDSLTPDRESATWERTVALDATAAGTAEETWTYGRRSFRMSVTVGKPFDVLSLKGADLQETRRYAAFLEDAARRLYAAGAPHRLVETCPCCDRSTTYATEALRIFDVPYHRCLHCGHVFVRRQPAEAILNEVFADSEQHAATYTDSAATERRIEQISVPKLTWAMRIFHERYGCAPVSAIDVGAGGGHFVAALRRAGLTADGFELSAASRAFARQAFGIELATSDFVEAAGRPVDLITMWGLLEYTPTPRRFLRAAKSRLSSTGLLVIEVPRFDALGTAAQACNPRTVARHMDPTSHVNCFTDASLATALVEEGFQPVAAWYFGMDVYELLTQAALRLDSAAAIERLADMIPRLQASADQGRQCDDIVMAAVPAL